LYSLTSTVLNAALSRSASLSTNAGFLPPNSKIYGTRLAPAAIATFLPFSGLPVNTIKSHGNVIIS